MDYFKKFDSVGAFRAYLENTPISASYKSWGCASHKEGRVSWFGTESYQDADELMIYGDKDSAAKMAAAAVRLRGGSDGSRRAFVDSVAGFTPNVPNYLRGLPCSMITASKVATKNKVINLVYNQAANWMITTDELAEAGAKVLAAVVAAEKNGYRVNMYAAGISKSKSGLTNTALFVKIKDAASYITPAKIAYFLVNPSFLRRHKFAYLERQPLTGKDWKNYGYPQNSIEKVRAAAAAVGISGACLTYDQVKNMTVQQIADAMTGAAK